MEEQIKTQIEGLINSSDVFLFMKGSPEAPECGFSANIVELLNNQEIEFKSFNILSNQELREAIKEFGNWPTYPQLYVKNKLVGGNDIVSELAHSGELKTLLK